MSTFPQYPAAVKDNRVSENKVTISGTLSEGIRIPRKEPGQLGIRFMLTVANSSTAATADTKPQNFSCVAWDEAAEQVIAAGAGAFVRVSGRLKRSSWTDKATQLRRFDTEIVCSSVDLAQ